MSRNRKSAFTLIELLTVIAIIGILAGILIPTVGAVKKQAKIATSKANFKNYISALNAFKSTYGFYPTFDANPDSDGQVFFRLGTGAVGTGVSREFIETLSGRTEDGDSTSGWKNVNRRRETFYTFTDADFYNDGAPVPTQIADSFNNTDIEVYIDTQGRGFVEIEGETVRTPIAIRSIPDRTLNFPEVRSWE